MDATEVYFGSRDALQAEVGLLPCYAERYQVAAFGPNGEEFTPEGATTKSGLKALVADYRRLFPAARFIAVA